MASTIGIDNPLVLSSASPRRREILESLGLPIRVHATEVSELQILGETPLAYLERVVTDKLQAAAGHVPGVVEGRYAALLVADTIVVLDSDVLGKPADVAEAKRLLARLSGCTHTVYTRYAIAEPDRPERAVCERTVATRVTMRSASEAELERYAETGEGLDKAGAYAAQGIGTFLIERVDGSYTNVVGLPVCELIQDLVRLSLLRRFP